MKKALLIGANIAMACVFSAAAHAGAVIELKPIETIKIKPVETVTQPGATTGKVLDFTTAGSAQKTSCDKNAVADAAAEFAKAGVQYAKAERVIQAGVVPLDSTCGTEATKMDSDLAKNNLIDIGDCALNQDVMKKNLNDRMAIYGACAAQVMKIDLQAANDNIAAVKKKCGYVY